jgi:hypothetical protein
MKALSISKKWEYLSQQKTWVEIFENTVEINGVVTPVSPQWNIPPCSPMNPQFNA